MRSYFLQGKQAASPPQSDVDDFDGPHEEGALVVCVCVCFVFLKRNMLNCVPGHGISGTVITVDFGVSFLKNVCA